MSLTPEDQLDAALEVLDCLRVLKKSESDLFKEAVQGQKFIQWQHYPSAKDVIDPVSHSQYFFHAHAPERPEWEDFGHFHTFLRRSGFSEDESVMKDAMAGVAKKDICLMTHFIAISLDEHAVPVRLFTTNRWITQEMWRPAEVLIAKLDEFEIDLSKPSWPLNRWISAMMVLYHSEIEQLLRERDEAIVQWRDANPDRNVYDARELAVPSALDIDINAKFSEVRAVIS